MKIYNISKILFALIFFLSGSLSAQINVKVDPSKIKSAKSKKDLVYFKYIEEHPEEMAGTYYRKSDINKYGASWTTELEITIKKDGTCYIRTYNSGALGRPPKTVEGTGTWGLAVDPETKELKKSTNEEGTWYEIVLVTDSDKPLPYYDRLAWYDKILLRDGTSYLKVIFSDKGKIKKQ